MSLNKFANSEVELRRVGAVNARVGSRDPIYYFLCTIEVGDKWRHDVIVEKAINVDQNSHSQTAMFSFQIVDQIRRELVANCVHTADA